MRLSRNKIDKYNYVLFVSGSSGSTGMAVFVDFLGLVAAGFEGVTATGVGIVFV